MQDAQQRLITLPREEYEREIEKEIEDRFHGDRSKHIESIRKVMLVVLERVERDSQQRSDDAVYWARHIWWHLRRMNETDRAEFLTYTRRILSKSYSAGLVAVTKHDWLRIADELFEYAEHIRNREPDRLLNHEQAADIVGCSAKTIGRRLDEGELTPHGKHRKVSEREVRSKKDTLLERRPKKTETYPYIAWT